tara:strand:+ start:2426 stop:3352 length:927 start_codon:yes stop_codon:yes gene_type:complete
MKKEQHEKLTSLLEEIKSKMVIKGNITEFRDVHMLWELGLLIKEIIGNSKNFKELLERIVIDYDWKIFGTRRSESDYAYNWVKNFQDKDYFLKICKYAGYREGDKNRFRKRDLRYLVSIYSRTSSSLTPAKRKKLEAIIGTDQVLDMSAEEFHALTVKIKGNETVHWEKMKDAIKELELRVLDITDSLNKEKERDEFRKELGTKLIEQLSGAMQICVIDNASNHEYAMAQAKDEFKKKSGSKNIMFQGLFDSLKNLLVDFKKKQKLVPKLDMSNYDFEQLASKLDALVNEKEFQAYSKRKDQLQHVLR